MVDGTLTNDAATPPEPLPPSRGTAANIFLNEQGLRSGWRLLVYSAFVFGIYFVVSLMVSAFARLPRGSFSYVNQLLFECIGLTSALGAACIMALIEKRSPGTYGLPLQRAFGKDFWFGWLFGFCEISGVVLSMTAFGSYSFGTLALHGMEIARWAFLWLALFLVVGFFEEFLFRGYTLYTLSDGVGFWPAAIFLSLLFGWVHRGNPGENWIGLLGVVVVGFFWCFTLKRTGSLWFAVGMHASFDFGETFLYSVPDSGTVFPGHLSNAALHGPAWITGGSVGPEASVFDFLLLAVLFCLFHFLFPAKDKSAFAN